MLKRTSFHVSGFTQHIKRSLCLLFAMFVSTMTYADAAKDCQSLQYLDLSNLDGGNAAANITKASLVKGEKIASRTAQRTELFAALQGAPIKDGTTDLPDHCLIEGYSAPTIRFEMRLPLPKAWNGNYLMSSCDGFCGAVQSERTMGGVIRNYATMTHDGGHTAFGFDGLWARNNLQTRIDFGHRANHVLAIAAKAIVENYYGRKPRYSFIAGCSKGGQAGVMAAQRYPGDYDGVVARGPTINYTKVNLINCMDNAKDILDENEQPIIDMSYAGFIKDAVMAACDESDGLKDGIITDPRKCDFKPASLQCGNNDNEKCLTAKQVKSLEGLYAPSVDSKGNELYGGLPYGSEEEWKGWVFPYPNWKPFHYNAATQYLKYLAYPYALPADYNWRDFSYENEVDRLAEMTTVFDADNPDLREFRDRGGKMIVLHGWSDAAIPAYASIRWYEDVMQFMGGLEKTKEFARMFLLPGVVHCGLAGPGPNKLEALDALEKWLSEGTAPDELLTVKTEQGKTVRTRPVYPYPLVAQYKGSGDIDKAKNFAPAMP